MQPPGELSPDANDGALAEMHSGCTDMQPGGGEHTPRVSPNEAAIRMLEAAGHHEAAALLRRGVQNNGGR
jgi:hypothetical protein